MSSTPSTAWAPRSEFERLDPVMYWKSGGAGSTPGNTRADQVAGQMALPPADHTNCRPRSSGYGETLGNREEPRVVRSPPGVLYARPCTRRIERVCVRDPE